MSEICKYENEIKRLLKILDGNARGGLVKDVTEMKTKQDTMCVNIEELKEIAEAQSKSISAFQQYQNAQEILQDATRNSKRSKRQMWMFFIGQGIIFLSIVVTILIEVLKK